MHESSTGSPVVTAIVATVAITQGKPVSDERAASPPWRHGCETDRRAIAHYLRSLKAK